VRRKSSLHILSGLASWWIRRERTRAEPLLLEQGRHWHVIAAGLALLGIAANPSVLFHSMCVSARSFRKPFICRCTSGASPVVRCGPTFLRGAFVGDYVGQDWKCQTVVTANRASHQAVCAGNIVRLVATAQQNQARRERQLRPRPRSTASASATTTNMPFRTHVSPVFSSSVLPAAVRHVHHACLQPRSRSRGTTTTQQHRVRGDTCSL